MATLKVFTKWRCMPIKAKDDCSTASMLSLRLIGNKESLKAKKNVFNLLKLNADKIRSCITLAKVSNKQKSRQALKQWAKTPALRSFPSLARIMCRDQITQSLNVKRAFDSLKCVASKAQDMPNHLDAVSLLPVFFCL